MERWMQVLAARGFRMSDGQDIHETRPGGDESFPRLSRDSQRDDAREVLAAGTQIGPFRIVEKVGQGGMGVVYKAWDTKLERYVAIKSLPAEVRHNEAVRSRLQREATFLAQLRHPNILTIYGLEETADGIYLVLEYVDGETLATHLAQGRLSVSNSLSIAVQVAAALVAAHERHIIHRDLKPGNIMITKEDQVKVLDFGLAKATDMTALGSKSPPTQAGVALGTVPYMSPELVRGEAADERTDIWSLGVVLYEMLTGQLPFRGATELALLDAIRYEEPGDMRQWREDVPFALERLVFQMLEKELSQRPGSMEHVAHELKMLCQERTSPARCVEDAMSIAVLPFADRSPNQDQEYFCDGIAEEIINALTRIPRLRVIARTSAFSYKGKNLGIRHIGRELNVQTVLEGSVRWAQDRLRVTAQLDDAKSEHPLWSETYNRPKGDIFSIQDEITSAIVNRLKLTLADQEKARLAKRRPANLEAYHLYLQGCCFRTKGTPGALQRAFEYFQQAIERDPRYALAYVGLALSYALAPFYSLSSPVQTVPRAKQMLSRALQIDEMLPDVRGALGFIKTWFDWDWAGAEREIRLAIELNPGCDRFHLWYAHCLMLQGRYQEARQEVYDALAMDPNSVLLRRELGMISCFAHDYERAIDTLQKTLELDSSIMYAHAHLGVAYLGQALYEAALREFQKEREVARGSHTWADTLEGIVRAQMGQVQVTREVLGRLREQSKQVYVSPFHLACLHLALGQDEAGFQWLNTAYDGQDLWLCFLKATPLFDRIGTDPRCVELLRKMKLG